MQRINLNRKYHIWSNPFKKSGAILGQKIEGKIGVRRAEKGHCRGRTLSYYLTQMCLKMATCPLINTKYPVQKWLNPVKFGQS